MPCPSLPSFQGGLGLRAVVGLLGAAAAVYCHGRLQRWAAASSAAAVRGTESVALVAVSGMPLPFIALVLHSTPLVSNPLYSPFSIMLPDIILPVATISLVIIAIIVVHTSNHCHQFNLKGVAW